MDRELRYSTLEPETVGSVILSAVSTWRHVKEKIAADLGVTFLTSSSSESTSTSSSGVVPARDLKCNCSAAALLKRTPPKNCLYLNRAHMSFSEAAEKCGLCRSPLGESCLTCNNGNDGEDEDAECPLVQCGCVHVHTFHLHCLVATFIASGTQARCPVSTELWKWRTGEQKDKAGVPSIIVCCDDGIIHHIPVYPEMETEAVGANIDRLVIPEQRGRLLVSAGGSLAGPGEIIPASTIWAWCGRHAHEWPLSITIKNPESSKVIKMNGIPSKKTVAELHASISTSTNRAPDSFHLVVTGSNQRISPFWNLCDVWTMAVEENKETQALALSIVLESEKEQIYTIDLWTASYPIRESLDSLVDSKTVEMLYANRRRISETERISLLSNRQYESTASAYSGTQAVFSQSLHWQPSIFPQTVQGASTFLSCLYVLSTSTHHWNSENRLRLLGFLRRVMIGTSFPPAILCWKAALESRSAMLGAEEKNIVATSLWKWMSKQLSSKIGPTQIFEHSRVALSFLCWGGGLDDSKSEIIHTTERTLPGWYPAPTDSVLFRAWRLAWPQSTLEPIEWFAGLASSSSVAYPIPKWKELLQHSNETRVLCIAAPLNLRRAPQPSLTRNKEGTIVVYCGAGKDEASSVLLFHPISGQELNANPQSVARDLAKIMIAGGSETDAMEERKTTEAVVVLLDISQSMVGSVFQTPEESDPIERARRYREWPAAKLDSKSLMTLRLRPPVTTTTKGTLDLTPPEILEARKWLLGHPHFQLFKAMANHQISHGYGFPVRQEWIAMNVLRELVLICWYPKNSTNNTKPLALTMARYRDYFVQILLQGGGGGGGVEEDKKGNDSRGDNNHCTSVNPNFLCPITYEVMKDPVIATDGYTYERSAIEEWFKYRQSSPMTSLLLSSKLLLPNHTLKSLINDQDSNTKKKSTSSQQDEDAPEDDQDDEYFEIMLGSNESSQTIRLTVTPTMKLTKFRSMALHLLGFPTGNNEKFMIGNVELKEGGTLRDFGIIRGSQINIVVSKQHHYSVVPNKQDSNKKKYEVIIRDTDSRSKNVKVLARFLCHQDDTVSDLKFKFWRAMQTDANVEAEEVQYNPTMSDFWCNVKMGADNYFTGNDLARYHDIPLCRVPVLKIHRKGTPVDYLKLGDRVRGRGTTPAEDYGNEKVYLFETIVLEIMPRNETETTIQSRLDRLTTVKILANAWINRCEAHDYPIQYALVLFGSSVQVTCHFTPLLDEFRLHIEEAEASGDTCLYDAIQTGCDLLVNLKDPNIVLKRIVCWSDGRDTKSVNQSPHLIAAKCQEHKIVLDAVRIGTDSQTTLRAMAKATNGYYFEPSTLSFALKLNELEPFLSLQERPICPAPRRIRFEQDLNRFLVGEVDLCTDDVVPIRKNQYRDKLKERNLQPLSSITFHSPPTTRSTTKVMESKGSGSGGSSQDRNKRLISEMKNCQVNSHPNIDIYVNEDDLTFWVVVITGNETTPYKSGVWPAYLSFGPEYPHVAPEFRFATDLVKIRHCNMNAYGKVCHSVFANNYNVDISVVTMLQCVYDLFQIPEVSSPLDTSLASMFRDGSGVYETTIMTHTQQYALKDRRHWNRYFTSAWVAPSPPVAVIRACAWCSCVSTSLKICGHGCPIMARYCGVACQRNHWHSGHSKLFHPKHH